MSAGVYLVIVLAALTGDPRSALVVCVAFGAVRGSMVLIGARITSAERLARVHERFEAWREPVRRGVLGLLVLAAVVLAVAGGAPAVALALAAGALTVAVGAARRMRRGAPAPTADACSIVGAAPL